MRLIFKQKIMKAKQLLCLLAIVPLAFSSCKKDDKDYRDKFEGTYATDVVGSISLPDIGWYIPVDDKDDIVVNKLGQGFNQIMLIVGGGVITATVDEQGNFTIPTESGTHTEIDPETGMRLTMNLTITKTGFITNKFLYIKETWSGNALLEGNGEKYPSPVSGTIAYNGTKK